MIAHPGANRRRRSRGRDARKGVAVGEAHREGFRRRPEARDGFGTRWPRGEAGPRRGWEKGEGRGSPRCSAARGAARGTSRSEEHTSELQSQSNLVCRLLLEKKKQ